MKIARRALVLGLAGIFLFSISCKRRPVAPPVQHPPQAPSSASPTSKRTTPSPRQAEAPPLPPGTTPVSPPVENETVSEIPQTIRVGLATNVTEAQITARGQMFVETFLGNERPDQVANRKVTFTVRSPGIESAAAEDSALEDPPRGAAVYRIQVASFQDESRAQTLKRELAERLRVPVVIEFNPVLNTYRVRVGDCATRMEAESLGERLQDAGYLDGWVVSEDHSRVISTSVPSERFSGVAETLRVLNDQNLEMDSLPLAERSAAPTTVVRITPANPDDFLTYDNLAYRGTLELVENDRGLLNVVNVVGLDDYLKGVVPNEMPPAKFDALEALKAQAVAARTYALKNRGRFLRQGFEICATIACQIYRGVDSERPSSTEAIEATRGVVIEYRGHLIDAMYTSTCGGHTEDASNIFGSMDAPYLRGVLCPPENAPVINPRLVAVSGYRLHWNVRITREQLEQTLRKYLPLHELVDIEPLRYGVSRRVIELRVKGRKRSFILRGLEVKSALGLKDSLFTLKHEYGPDGKINAFDFTGRGWGHGVGLCQTGAYGLALLGEDYVSILKTYYSDVDVVQENTREN